MIEGLAEGAAERTQRATVLHELMERVGRRIAYKTGVSTVETTAIEALARGVVHPVVLLELAHAAGQIGRKLFELLAPLLGTIFEELLASLVARRARLVDAAVDALAFLLDDLVELIRDVLVDATEVVAVELLAPAFTQLLQHLPHTAHVAAFTVLEALLHHAPQRGVEITVVEQVVGHLLQQRVGVEVEADLRTVPTRVLEARRHGV